MSERKAGSRKGIGGPKPNATRVALMAKYGLKRWQLRGTGKLEQFAKCTDLGMEILLIMMRLERRTNLGETCRRGSARRNEIRKARFLSPSERAEAKRLPWAGFSAAAHSEEPASRVEKLVALAAGRMVA